MSEPQIEQVQARVIEILETEYHDQRLATTYIHFATAEKDSMVAYLNFNPENEDAPNFNPDDQVELSGYTETAPHFFLVQYYETRSATTKN